MCALSPIYIEEGLWDRLLELVLNERQLDSILQYHTYLAKRYPQKLLEIYLPALEREGDRVADRSGYADLAVKMKRIMKDIPAGKEGIFEVAERLKIRYSRRPAMIEELNKVLKL